MRFGDDVFTSAMEAMLERNKRAMRELIRKTVPEKKQYFEDYVCDDGMGMGPYKIACSMWREGDTCIFDFEGTDPQSIGSINFLLNEEMFKMFAGVYMIMVFDPQILFNDGFYDLMEVRIPKGTLLKPLKPAALSCRTHALGRIFDVLGGLLGQGNPAFMCAAGFSDSPHFMYSGYDKNGKWLFKFGEPGTGANRHDQCHRQRDPGNTAYQALARITPCHGQCLTFRACLARLAPHPQVAAGGRGHHGEGKQHRLRGELRPPEARHVDLNRHQAGGAVGQDGAEVDRRADHADQRRHPLRLRVEPLLHAAEFRMRRRIGTPHDALNAEFLDQLLVQLAHRTAAVACRGDVAPCDGNSLAQRQGGLDGRRGRGLVEAGQHVGLAGLVGDEHAAAIANRLGRHVLVGARVLLHGGDMQPALVREGRRPDIGRVTIGRAVEDFIQKPRHMGELGKLIPADARLVLRGVRLLEHQIGQHRAEIGVAAAFAQSATPPSRAAWSGAAAATVP